MAIKMFMISTGQKIIGDVISEIPNILVKQPFILAEVVSDQNKIQLVPLPIMPVTDNILKFSEHGILVYPCDPKKDFVDMYNQLTSNIIIPKSDLKLV